MTNFTIWTLMHKQIPVADVELLERNATIMRIVDTYNIHHAPLGTVVNGVIDYELLERWLGKRAIPASRTHIDEVLEKLNLANTRVLSLKGFGLNLSDHYWLKPMVENISWDEVNFFLNGFSGTIGEVMTRNSELPVTEIDFLSPDSSVDGWLEKKWMIEDGKRILIKGANPLYNQEPYNEKIATDIMNLLGINHIAYDISILNNKPYSKCETFATATTELIPAVNVVKAIPPIDADTRLSHLLRNCEQLGMDVEPIKQELDKMMVLDYMIGNYDRHWRNFGFIRKAETLEWLGFAPIFDSGASLWQFHEQINDDVKSLTFAETLKEQLKFVKDFSWYRPISDEILYDTVYLTLDKHPTMQTDRKRKISKQVVANANYITKLALK